MRDEVLRPYEVIKISNAKTKVSLITRSVYPSSLGGIAIHVHYISKILSKEFEVCVFSEGVTNSSIELSSSNDVNLALARVPSIPFLSSLIFILRGLLDHFSRVRPVDIVHAHQALTPAVLAFLICRIHKIPLIITCHGSDIRTTKVGSLVWVIQRFLFSWANHLTVVSDEMKKVLAKSYNVDPAKVSVIPNGYDEPTIAQLIENTRTSNSMTVITFVGSLRPLKDPLTLLRGFARALIKNHSDVELRVVGDGPLLQQLKLFSRRNGLSPKVFFMGRKPHIDALGEIAKSDIFILTSIEEGLPIALIEAMALGKAVIATSVGGVLEIVKDKLNGMLIPSKSPECLAEVLGRLLKDTKLRKRLGVAARNSIASYTWKAIAERYNQIYAKSLRLSRGA